MTVQERIDSLAAVPGVLAAFRPTGPEGEFRSLGGNLHAALVKWYVADGDISESGKANLYVANAASEDPEAVEVAYWAEQLPEPLRPVAPEVKYLTARTTGNWANLTGAAQKTAILGFCNAVYKAATVGARDIREFAVTPIDGNTVKISGHFNIGTSLNEWAPRTWYIRLIDANGSVASPYSNIEFHQVTD